MRVAREELARYIESIAGAADPQQALTLYSQAGGFAHVGRGLGEFVRGRQMAALLEPHAWTGGVYTTVQRSYVLNDLGLFAQATGDLPVADAYFAAGLALDLESNNAENISIAYKNLAKLELSRGRLDLAAALAELALNHWRASARPVTAYDYYAVLGYALFFLGRTDAAHDLFTIGRDIADWRLMALRELEAETLIAHGRAQEAKQILTSAIPRGDGEQVGDSVASCRLLLAEVLFDENPGATQRLLDEVRAWLEETAHAEIAVRLTLASARHSLRLDEVASAATAASVGITSASRRGFARWEVDLQNALAEAHHRGGDMLAAIDAATAALARATHGVYPWGRAAALHWRGVSRARLGQRTQGWQDLAESATLRGELCDPHLRTTMSALSDLDGGG